MLFSDLELKLNIYCSLYAMAELCMDNVDVILEKNRSIYYILAFFPKFFYVILAPINI